MRLFWRWFETSGLARELEVRRQSWLRGPCITHPKYGLRALSLRTYAVLYSDLHLTVEQAVVLVSSCRPPECNTKAAFCAPHHPAHTSWCCCKATCPRQLSLMNMQLCIHPPEQKQFRCSQAAIASRCLQPPAIRKGAATEQQTVTHKLVASRCLQLSAKKEGSGHKSGHKSRRQ